MALAVQAKDGPLPLARERLDAAVAALVDAVKGTGFDGVILSGPSVYQRLVEARAALAGRQGAFGAARSLPPIRCDVVDLLVDIDDTTRMWWARGRDVSRPDSGCGDTPKRLRALAAAKWRPQDTQLLDDYAAQLEYWVRAAGELLEPPVAVWLPSPCPSCGAEHAYRDDGAGENVRSRALRATEHGAWCAVCGASWCAGEFRWLATLLAAT